MQDSPLEMDQEDVGYIGDCVADRPSFSEGYRGDRADALSDPAVRCSILLRTTRRIHEERGLADA